MDDEILRTVHSMFGKDVEIVDCEKMSSMRQEELLFINGVPVPLDRLDGDEAEAIKAALLIGKIPSVDLLNQLLMLAGLLKQPVQFETSLSVKSTIVTTEEVCVSRNGSVLNERLTETKEDYTYNCNKTEFWKPHHKYNINETDSDGAKVMDYIKCSPPNRAQCQSGEKKDLCKSATISELNIPIRSISNQKETYELNAVGNLTQGANTVATRLLCSSNSDSTLSTTMPNYSIHSSGSSMDMKRVGLVSSSCALMLNNAPHVQNIIPLEICKKYNLMYDSGHDGIFKNMSKTEDNSLSLGCDFISSSSRNEIGEGNKFEEIEKDEKDIDDMNTTAALYNVVPCRNTYDVELKSLSQMLHLSSNVNSDRNRSGSNGSASSILKTIGKNAEEIMLSALQCSTVSTNAALSASKTSQSTSPLPSNNENDQPNSEAQHLNNSELKKYQYIRPQTLYTQCKQHKQQGDQQHCLVYCNNQLVAGSLESLIKHMVPTSDYYPTSNYIFSFLLSARLFIRPHELLSKISTTWDQQQQQDITQTDVVDDTKEIRKSCINSSVATISSDHICAGAKKSTTASQEQQRHKQLSMQLSAHNCIRLLAEWIETFPYDFRDERLMQQVRILARKCVYIDNAIGKQVSRILQLLVQRLTVLEKYEEFLQSLATVELQATNSTLDKAYASSYVTSTTTPTIHNPLGKSSTTVLSTAINNQSLLQSSISAGNASSSYCTQSVDFSPHSSNNDALQHNNPQNDNSKNSVNLTLHHLSGHFTISNSSTSFNESPGIIDLCPSSAQLAHQLTTIELERLSHIGPEEFVQAFAKEYQHAVASQHKQKESIQEAIMCNSLSDIKKTRNLESYVQWFNRLSYLTASEIVKYKKKKQRVRIIEYWIETARECFNIGNFNSLMAIIAGLNLAPISRLKKTWSKVQSAKFSVLEHQMDPTSNFNSYRSTLKAAMWRSEGATDERERIIIPFFSLFVKDIYFLNESCSNRLSNNHINFEKCSQLSKQVMEFNEWKKVHCPFKKQPIVIIFLQSSAVLNENTLSMASFECEPPENTQERGRYKTLKSETKQQIQQQLYDQKQNQQH